MKKFALAAVSTFLLLFAVAALRVTPAHASTSVVPIKLHLQTGTPCPSGAAHCALLSWTAGAVDASHDAASNYNVYRSLSATGCATVTGAGCQKVGSVAAPNTTYTDSPLVAGTTYYYVTTAANSGGESAASNQVQLTPAALPPSAPTGLTGTAQ